MIEQGGVGLVSLDTSAVSQAATNVTFFLSIVLGEAPGLQSNGVDVGTILVGKAAKTTWSGL